MAIEKILIKRTGVAGRVPTAESLDVGELAINTADKKIYSKHGDEVIEFTETPASVKAKYESNANTNVFTDAEKTKLGGLDSNHFKGLYASLSALQTAHPTAVSGDYANVDAGIGAEVQSYIWDASDNEWVLQMGESTAETAASIKTKYESNPDTNAFTDNEKTKLAWIEAGATADMTAAEIKTAYESNDDTNAFTDAEKTKLGGLDSNHFKGLYASLSALQTAHPTAVSGDYANVDAGAGSEVQSYIWDASDNEWVLQMGESTAETAASIKTKYESNPDTNAFTDAYKGQVDTNATNIGTLQTQMGDIATALDLINGE